MKRHTLAQIVKTATEIYKIPSINSCNLELIGNDKISVETEFNQLDLDRNEQTKFLKRYLFQVQEDEKTLNLLDSSKPIPVRADSMRIKSRGNTQYQASVTNWKDNKNDEKQFLEIWNGDNRIENINLTKLGKHDKFYDGTLVWSLDSTKLAYIAEAKKTRKVSSFFTVSSEENVDETNHEEKYSNVYIDSWGEQNIDKVHSIIAIFDLNSLEVNVIENIPNDVCPSSLTWYKNDGIVFAGLYTQPYKLGLIYCPTRKSELFYYDLNEKTCVQLTNTNESVRSPRFSNDFKHLCWLQNQVNGPHFPCSKLMLMPWEDKKNVEILVDLVKEESDGGFNGIFSLNLLNKCWSLDNKRIILSSQTGHNVRVISCDVVSKIVSVLDNNFLSDASSCDVLYFDENDWICASFQSYNRKPTIALAKLPSHGQENEIKWNIIEKENLLININILKLTPEYENKKFNSVKFEALLIHQNDKNDSLVVFPHGGPHSAFSGEFSPHVAVMVRLGYSVLLVNYRGSTGYGQNSIDSLPGDIGTQDVKDMQQAAEYCLKEYNFKKSFVYGGSHGGFLSAHLIGQYPDFYSAAAIRNPVIQLEGFFVSLFLSTN
jgi:acylaminoacyl-peptidase